MVVVVALARTVQLQKPQCFGGIDILFCGVFGKNVFYAHSYSSPRSQTRPGTG